MKRRKYKRKRKVFFSKYCLTHIVKYGAINAKFEELKQAGLLVPGATPQAFSEGLQEVKDFFRYNVLVVILTLSVLKLINLLYKIILYKWQQCQKLKKGVSQRRLRQLRRRLNVFDSL